MSLGFLFGEVAFAKWGIPLRATLIESNAYKQPLKFFVFEQYLFVLLVCLIWCSIRHNHLSQWKSKLALPLSGLILFFLAWSFCRLFPDLNQSPVLSIRNAAFSWYLLLPLVIFFLGVSVQALELNFLLISIALLLKTLAYLTLYFFYPDLFQDHITPQLGFLLLMLYPFIFRERFWPWVIPAILGISFGIQLAHKVQRTTALGFLLFLLVAVFSRTPIKKILRMVSLSIVFCIAAFALVVYSPRLNNARKQIFSTTDNPLFKSERTTSGMEIYRWSMWEDAWQEFKSHPLLGIGFYEQVVKRVYVGAGKYYSNDGMHEANSAPIAGPHNSYLNGLARLGFLGIFLLFIHFWALKILYRHKLAFSFCALLGQMIYAGFNVGLEGPARSFFLLLALGCALSASLERKLVAR